KIAELVHEAVPDMRLRVVGSAPSQEEEEKIRSFLQKNGLSEYVILEGFQSNVAPFFQSASVLLWTASFEGAPMAMAEGKAFGLPLVAYDLANVDMVRQRKGMIVVPQKAAREAASHVIDLLLNVEKRRELGRQARESAEEMDAVDLGKVWDDIFALALAPYQPVSATEVKPPLEAALEIALNRIVVGHNRRAQLYEKEPLPQIEQLQQQIEQLQQQNAQYAVMVEQLTHSHLFLVGRIVTWPFRKIKKLLHMVKTTIFHQ
ncbi:MAG: glycosyltransferase, partial [Clostridia bacterium]|nr:glycosyltransferase [Clostridia bacterium]